MQHDAEVAALVARASRLAESLRSAGYEPAADTSHAWHMDWLERAALLGRHLSAALTLEGTREYPSALSVVRTALEHHLTDRLIIAANRYEQRWTATTVEEADRLYGEFCTLADDPESDVESVTRTRQLRFRVIRHAPRFANAPEQWLSAQGAWADEYDPFTGRERHLDYVEAPFMDVDDLRARAREAGDLWENVFSFRGILANLELNALLTRAERLQLDLHYAFLSAFAHATTAGYEEVFGRNRPRTAPAYDHYVSELIALYVIRLTELEFALLSSGLARPPACGISDWNALEFELTGARQAIEYFWFLGGGPTDADRARAANHLMSRANPERPWEAEPVDPASLTSETMPYALNPLSRLVSLHASWSEMTTRMAYRSPWERPDAMWR